MIVPNHIRKIIIFIYAYNIIFKILLNIFEKNLLERFHYNNFCVLNKAFFYVYIRNYFYIYININLRDVEVLFRYIDYFVKHRVKLKKIYVDDGISFYIFWAIYLRSLH